MTATETVGSLVVDLLRAIYGDRAASVELSPAGTAVEPPASLPAIRVRVNDARLDPLRGQVHGQVLVVVYTDAEHPLRISHRDMTTTSGTLHRGRVELPSGDLRRITEDMSPTVSTLPDGITATAHRWTISNAVPAVPVLTPGKPTEHVVSAFAQSLAVSISRPPERGDVGSRRALVKATVLHASCTDHAVQGDRLARTVAVSLLVSPTTEAVERKALSALGGYQGRAVDGLGRVTDVVVDDVTPVPTGTRISVRLLVVCALPSLAA